MQHQARRRYYPLVSIVTVNYNQSEVTCSMIESLNKINYPNIEVLVVDNASPDDNPDIIKHRFPAIDLIKNPINYGFAAGNNFGIMKARGAYVLLLNNDTVVTPDFLEPLVEKMESDPTIGAVSPKLRFYHTPNTIQYAGYTEMNPYTVRNFSIGFNQVDKGQYDKDRLTPFAHGAAMLVSMEVIKKVGMMSYIFFLYYEEADWCERIKKSGYSIWYISNSLVYHRESISTGRMSVVKIYYLNRNRLIFMRRNMEGKTFYLAILFQFFVAIPKNAFVYLLKGKFKLFHAYYKAIGWHLTNLFNKEIHENPML
ncbi:MAG: glycosyltransferase family 2 protein [Bacteroidetes bacterium]|nr:glycosyltransferase family 2 protein [Bacteroidota bacterium]